MKKALTQGRRALSSRGGHQDDEEAGPSTSSGRRFPRRFTRRRRSRAVDASKVDEDPRQFQLEWGISLEEEDKRLRAFREALRENGVLNPVFDYFYLRRFLRARQHDVSKAKEMFVNHVKFREEHQVATILEDFKFPERDAFIAAYPQGYHKTDKLGRPVYIQHVGQINFKRIMEITTEEKMLRFHIQEYERCLKYIFPVCSKVAGRHIEKTMAILDVRGVGLKHVTGDVKRLVLKMMKVDSDNYPETLGKTLIINAPAVFRMVFNMFKPALDARTQAKIEVLGTSYHDALFRYIDPENVLEYLGGKSKGTLVDDIGPWNDPELVAEVTREYDFRIKRAQAVDHTTESDVDYTGPSDAEPGESESDFTDAERSARTPRGGYAAYTDDEAYYSPKSGNSFSSALSAVSRSGLLDSDSDASPAATPHAPSQPLPQDTSKVVIGSVVADVSDDALAARQLKLPVVARVQALEQQLANFQPELEQSLLSHHARKAIGSGTLMDRVEALEDAMEVIMKAQEVQLKETQRMREAAASTDTVPASSACGCCSVM